jgi:hypothetical protein
MQHPGLRLAAPSTTTMPVAAPVATADAVVALVVLTGANRLLAIALAAVQLGHAWLLRCPPMIAPAEGTCSSSSGGLQLQRPPMAAPVKVVAATTPAHDSSNGLDLLRRR